MPVQPQTVAPKDDPLVDAARRVAAEVLLPRAAQCDTAGIERDTLAALGAAGLLGMAAPVELGGTGAGVHQWRRVGEALMAADGTAWFCWSQHHALVRALVPLIGAGGDEGRIAAELLPGLVSGERFAAVSFSHVRRPGPPALTAERVGPDWCLTGRVDWVTAWDVADLALILVEHHGQILQFAVDTAEQPGLSVGDRLPLMAMAGSHTRPVAFDGLLIPGDRLVGRYDRATWLRVDEQVSALPSPAAFGLAVAAVNSITSLADRRDSEPLRVIGRRLRDETDLLRTRSYSAIDDGRATAADLIELRAAGLDLAMRASAAALTAGGAAGLLTGSHEERRYREAAFLLVFRQTDRSRLATLQAGTHGSPEPRQLRH